jgi:hypothetical protein
VVAQDAEGPALRKDNGLVVDRAVLEAKDEPTGDPIAAAELDQVAVGEGLAVQGAQGEAVVLETQRLDDLLVLGGRGVEVLAPDVALVLLRQPAYGGLDLRADRSAGQEVVRHLERLRFLGQRRSKGSRE